MLQFRALRDFFSTFSPKQEPFAPALGQQTRAAAEDRSVPNRKENKGFW